MIRSFDDPARAPRFQRTTARTPAQNCFRSPPAQPLNLASLTSLDNSFKEKAIGEGGYLHSATLPLFSVPLDPSPNTSGKYNAPKVPEENGVTAQNASAASTPEFAEKAKWEAREGNGRGRGVVEFECRCPGAARCSPSFRMGRWMDGISSDTLHIDLVWYAETPVPTLKAFKHYWRKAAWHRLSVIAFDNVDNLLGVELEMEGSSAPGLYDFVACAVRQADDAVHDCQGCFDDAGYPRTKNMQDFEGE
ncbi:hypothetical protein FIBSPDRAFT_1050540 [Athelia psychrophila]|uniref:Uncharacterized protein n=1 Tax=Athelia psychrophila TaxID=1759441 RepID=A0A166ALB9_9AGAM|nr:hypothetical protein FIBSPDRAFT_1050540 [Fibularhizoctonia sp. CBS 109695]